MAAILKKNQYRCFQFFLINHYQYLAVLNGAFKKQIFTTFLNPQMKSESTDEINKLNYNNINIIAFMSSDNKPLQIILKGKYQRD